MCDLLYNFNRAIFSLLIPLGLVTLRNTHITYYHAFPKPAQLYKKYQFAYKSYTW